ncbi:MAG TPA: BON domain-containing protein, partial [Gemmataceae bacterium]|nr:BON domain-containing protein [Gemmataceae bacterium]
TVIPLLLLVALPFCAGCNQQDAECLSRIGKKVAAHAKNGAGEVGGKVDFRWAHMEPSLQDKIVDRLRYENTLTELKFDVVVKGKEVELKGTVKSPLQRQRAIELAETVAGVDKVTDSLKVREEDETPKGAGIDN